MKVIFEYSRPHDIWCILNYGKGSRNSDIPTKTYLELISEHGDDPKGEHASTYIEKYIQKNNVNVNNHATSFQHDWNLVSDEYQKRAEKIFGVKIPEDITAYLTINNRCPYSIEENQFFVSMSTYSMRKTVMHELWHFYTWYKFGVVWEKKLGRPHYNDLKESLTALINVECRDLLPVGVHDNGYPQHQEIRDSIIDFWNHQKDIDKLWLFLMSK